MSVINVVIEEDELMRRVSNDIGSLMTVLKNQLYSESNGIEAFYAAYLQMAHLLIDAFYRTKEFIPNVQVYREKFDNGVLDPEHCEVVTYSSEHEDYDYVLLAAICNRYREGLTAFLMAASEDIQLNPRSTFYIMQSETYGYSNKESAQVNVQMLTEVRKFVLKYFVSNVKVFDYIINIAPILMDTTVSELIWKRYVKHNAKLGRDLAINNLVVGKLMVTDHMDAFAKLLDDTFEFVKNDTSIELDESSILYYKMNSYVSDKIVFEHRLGPYAQALFKDDTQTILSTPVIEGSIDKTMNKFGFRSKFIPVNIPTGEALKDARCEGLLAKFAS